MYKITDNDTGAWRVVSDDMWNGFMYGVPGLYHAYDNDFFVYTAGDWTVTSVGGGANVLIDADGGVMQMTTGGANDDHQSIQLGSESFLPEAGKRIFFEARIRVNTATLNDWLVGLCVTDTTPLTNTDSIVFRKDAGDTQIDTSVMVTSVESVESNVVTFAANTFYKVGFVVNGINSVSFYINDILVSTVDAVPQTEMRVTWHGQNGDAAVRRFDIDYVRCYKEI